VASTCTHILCDCDKNVKAFGLRNDDYLLTGVGPNPRNLINMIEGRPLHQNQYGGDDEFYLASLRKLAASVVPHIPTGSQGIWKKRLGNLRSVQFNACKLLIVFQYILTGLCGRHARKSKERPQVSLGLSDTEDEDEAAVLADLQQGVRKRRRAD